MNSGTEAVNAANSRQVGGRHYKTGDTEHWDLIHNADAPYLLGCASKYVARHHLKDGRVALEKAIHYMEKWVEKVNQSNPFRCWRVAPSELLAWASVAKLRGAEIQLLYTMLVIADIPKSLELTRALLELRHPIPTKFGSEPNLPGTPEDGGHHEPRPTMLEVSHEDSGDETDEPQEIRKYTVDFPRALPLSLSIHEHTHRCDDWVQAQYEYDVSAARYLLK